MNIAANGHTLQIKEAQISDTGRYTCVASNLAGEDELDFDVNIQGNTTMLIVEWFPCSINVIEMRFDLVYFEIFSSHNNIDSSWNSSQEIIEENDPIILF